MSLFKTEEFWSVKCGSDEKFVASTLCVLNFLSQPNKSDQIVCGSINGLLRMYSQVGKSSDAAMSSDGDTNPFSMENNQNEIDICIEYNLRSPVLQIAVGKFILDRTISIAVLSPQKLNLIIIDESTMTFKVMEEFSFQRIAYNFCYGNFGRVSDRDYVCVQSTDGTLSFYVNGHLSFVSFLASSLLPGPINYLVQDDSILVVSSSRFLEGYKYKNLAVCNASGLSTNQKRAIPDWTINIGENALNIIICDSVKDGSLVVVLSRYAFFIINNNNGVVLKKRFETRLRSIMAYGEVSNGCPHLLVTNCVGELMVFYGTSLKWKARLIGCEDVVSLTLGKFNNLSNFVVNLTEFGHLSILFLGTDPSLGAGITVPVSRDIVSNNHDAELGRLQQRIKTITTSDQGSFHVRVKETRTASVKLIIDHSSARLLASSSESSSPEFLVDLRVKATTEVSNVLVRVSVRVPLVSRETQFHFPSLAADREVVLSLSVRSIAAMVVCSLRGTIYVTYDTADRRLAVTQIGFSLPLSLVTEICSPCKQAAFKVTLDSNEPTVGLRKLFPELPIATAASSEDRQREDVALGLQYYHDGPVVTILASGTSTRYRLQSDNFEAIWLVLDELKHRLTQHFGRASFQLRYTDPIPLDAYFLVLDFHFSVRNNLRHYEQLLEQRSKQYRAIEKLLLSKTKDKSQSSLFNLDTLLENSLSQLMNLADLIEEQQQHLTIVGNALCSATSLVGCLLQLLVSTSGASGSMSEEQRHVLNSALSGSCRDYPDMGLEELYGLIYGHLLRHVVVGGTAVKPRSVDTPLSVAGLEFPANLDKLKKHISVLCDRITKGVAVKFDNPVREESSVDVDDAAAFGDSLKFVQSPRVAVNKSKKSKKKANKLELLE